MQHDVSTYRPKPDGAVDPAGEAGWYLQREREKRGETLQEASQTTGVHQRHLAAIEEGDLTELPARADTLRMVSLYAGHLGLDPQPLVLHYAQFLPRHPLPKRGRRSKHPLSSATIIEFPLARRMASLATGSGGIVASCAGAVLLFGIASWMFMPHADTVATGARIEVATVAPAPAEPDAAAGQEAVESGAIESQGEAPVASITTLTEEPLGDDEPTEPAKAAEQADQAANALDGLAELIEQEVAPTPLPAEGAGDRVFGAEHADARLILKAKAPVWIRIEDGKGNVVITQTLMKGDSYRVPNREGLVLIARDGGLLSYEVDGVAKGSLGRPGEILVGRALDITKLASKG